jgi:hypothetical protein
MELRIFLSKSYYPTLRDDFKKYLGNINIHEHSQVDSIELPIVSPNSRCSIFTNLYEWYSDIFKLSSTKTRIDELIKFNYIKFTLGDDIKILDKNHILNKLKIGDDLFMFDLNATLDKIYLDQLLESMDFSNPNNYMFRTFIYYFKVDDIYEFKGSTRIRLIPKLGDNVIKTQSTLYISKLRDDGVFLNTYTTTCDGYKVRVNVRYLVEAPDPNFLKLSNLKLIE